MRLTINGPLRYDDATVTAATVIAIVQSAVKLSQTDMGLGKTTADLSKPRLEEISRVCAGQYQCLLRSGFEKYANNN